MSPVDTKPIVHGRDHMCGGPDPIPGICDLTPVGDPGDPILSNPCLVAFWKLNEATGDVAADSGPDGHDLTSGSYSPPTWGEPDAPPGSPSAGFADGLGLNDIAVAGPGGATPALTGDFSAEIWFNRANTNLGVLIGQGSARTANNRGWSLEVGAFNEGALNRPKVMIGATSGGPHTIEADTPASTGTWYHVAFTRTSGTWRLYLNGAVQSTTSTATFDPTTGDGIWVGNDPVDTGQIRNFVGALAYAAVFDCALDADTVAAHYDAGVAAGATPAGYVLTTDGTGGRAWAAPTIEVEF